MEWEQPKIIQGYGTVHSEKEIKHQSKFQNHVGRQLFGQVFIAFPAVCDTVDVEFWSSYKLTAFSHMPFQDSNGVVQGEPKRYREEGKKQLDVIYKMVETTSLNAPVGKPVANKKYNGTDYEEAGNLEDPTQMAV